MKDLLGEVDEDLADFVIEHLRDKKGPDDLVEGLEPVSRSIDSRAISTLTLGLRGGSERLRQLPMATTRLRIGSI